jgi:YfiH family protein
MTGDGYGPTGDWLVPDWPVPENVRAVATSRNGGVSAAPWNGLNLGDHVGDDPEAVVENRRRLRQMLKLPAEPLWLKQVHGCAVADSGVSKPGCEADARISDRPGEVCAVLTADCLPLLFADKAGRWVAAAHAGWRGLAGGVIEQTVARFPGDPAALHVWLGPAIGPEAFEVGAEVRQAFVDSDPGADEAFRPVRAGHWLADLYLLARRRLTRCGVSSVHGGGFCTYTEAQRFFSYRRDGVTGRMASLIWLVD